MAIVILPWYTTCTDRCLTSGQSGGHTYFAGIMYTYSIPSVSVDCTVAAYRTGTCRTGTCRPKYIILELYIRNTLYCILYTNYGFIHFIRMPDTRIYPVRPIHVLPIAIRPILPLFMPDTS